MREELEAEVRLCHQAFVGWITGNADASERYESGLCGRLEPTGTYVTVSGQVRRLGDLLEDLRDARGVNPSFDVETGEVRVIDAREDRFVVLYEERTRGAQQSRSSEHTRWVTAVLIRSRAATGGFRWIHLHEVQVRPEDEV